MGAEPGRSGGPPRLHWRVVALLAALLVAGLCAAPAASIAQDDVRLRAEAQTFARLPVEIWPCQLAGQAAPGQGEQVTSVLESDLWLSSVIAAKVVSDTTTSPADGAVADVLLPVQRSIRVAVQTSLAVHGANAELQATILDLKTRRALSRKNYQGCAAKLRLLVHALADDVVNVLTGGQGIARSRIAFTASGFKGKELYLMDYDGANIEQVTRDGSLNLTPCWSRGARGLVYTSYKKGNPDLFIFDVFNKKSIPLLQGSELNTSPAWSPVADQFLFVSTKDGNAEIYKFDVKRRRATRLTLHPAIEASPAWSPTGRHIVFTSDRLGLPQLFLMDAEGSNVQRLDVGRKYVDSPVWSPRGDKIAFVSREESGFEICTYDLTTEIVTQLTSGPGSNEDPAWSPDGFRLAFSSTRDGGRDIYTMMWDGSSVERLTVKGTCNSPTWSENTRLPEAYLCK